MSEVRTALAFLISIASILLFATTPTYAADRGLTIVIPTVTTDPPLSGSTVDLLSPTWQSAFVARNFTDFNTKRPDPNGTEAHILFGKSGVFVAIEAMQRYEPILHRQTTDNVGIGLDDYVGVELDTTGTGELTYFFEVTPGGLRYQQASETVRYRPTWKAKSSIDDGTWFAELFIPYSALRRSAAKSDHWRLNFIRWVAANQQLITWAYSINAISPYAANEWPSVNGIPADLAVRRGSPSAEVYGLADVGGNRNSLEGPSGAFVQEPARTIGVDAKVPITGTLNFVGTLNPDYSNVENDQEITAPQEFARQYSEYRPFFTQGANFLPSVDVFYTPAIGIFNSGEKLEGEYNGLSIGVLNITGYQTDSGAYQLRVAPYNNQLILSLGGAYNTLPDASDNTVKGSISYQNNLSKLGFSADFAEDRGSLITMPSAANNWDIGTSISKSNYSISAGYEDVGAQYGPINSYLAQNDLHGFNISASIFTSEAPSGPVKILNASASGDRYLDSSGAVRLADLNLYGNVTFRDTISLSGAYENSQLRSYAIDYPTYYQGTTSPFNTNFVALTYLTGTSHATDVSYSWGQFSNYYLQVISLGSSTPISRRVSLSYSLQQAIEHYPDGLENGQILESASLIDQISSNTSASLSYRVVSGAGGSAMPGTNFALGFQEKTRTGNAYIFEFGSPAAPSTLNRFIFKYVQSIGGGTGL